MRRLENGFMLALTYGQEVDWFRNIVAAGGGAIRWNGKQYRVGKPEVVSVEVGRSAFPAPLRGILRLHGTMDFAQVRVLRSTTAPGKDTPRTT